MFTKYQRFRNNCDGNEKEQQQSGANAKEQHRKAEAKMKHLNVGKQAH